VSCGNLEKKIRGMFLRQSQENSIIACCLLAATDYITQEQAESLLNDAEELKKILAKIILTMKSKAGKPKFNQKGLISIT
jgi:hypothetical protein